MKIIIEREIKAEQLEEINEIINMVNFHSNLRPEKLKTPFKTWNFKTVITGTGGSHAWISDLKGNRILLITDSEETK